jgi:hypothetical protein
MPVMATAAALSIGCLENPSKTSNTLKENKTTTAAESTARLELTSVVQRPGSNTTITTKLSLLPSGLAIVSVQAPGGATSSPIDVTTEIASLMIADKIFRAADSTPFEKPIADLTELGPDLVNTRTLLGGCNKDETITYVYVNPAKDHQESAADASESQTEMVVNFAKSTGCQEAVLGGGNALQIKMALDALLKLSRI